MFGQVPTGYQPCRGPRGPGPVGGPSEGTFDAETALLVVAAVREQLGVGWTDLALGPSSALATFAVDGPAATELRIRRRDLLIDYVDRTARERAERIERRRVRSHDALVGVDVIRAYGVLVDQHVSRVRNRGGIGL